MKAKYINQRFDFKLTSFALEPRQLVHNLGRRITGSLQKSTDQANERTMK